MKAVGTRRCATLCPPYKLLQGFEQPSHQKCARLDRRDQAVLPFGVRAVAVDTQAGNELVLLKDTVNFNNLSSGLGNATRSVTLGVAVHPPIKLADFHFVDSTRIAMTLQGVAGKTYSIQRSANLSSWADVLPVTNVTGSISFTNAVPPDFTKGFYRAKEL